MSIVFIFMHFRFGQALRFGSIFFALRWNASSRDMKAGFSFFFLFFFFQIKSDPKEEFYQVSTTLPMNTMSFGLPAGSRRVHCDFKIAVRPVQRCFWLTTKQKTDQTYCKELSVHIKKT